MGYLIIVAVSYLIGSASLAQFLFRRKNVDQSRGSGNLGASNVTVLLGWSSGVAVGVHDIGKSLLAVILARFLFPELEYAGVVAGVSCVLGHIFPFYLRFKGGKGFASYLGMLLALNWKLALVILVLVVLVTVLTDYIVAGTTLTIVVSPIWLGIITRNLMLALILCIATAVMLFKHRENYRRIMSGTEIGLRSTAKGKHRVK